MLFRHPITYLFIMLLPGAHYAQQFEVASLKCNTLYNEFAPIAYNGGVVFCSDRPLRYGVTWLDESGNHSSKIYFAKQADAKKVELLSTNFASRFNEGPTCFDTAGTTCIYTGTLRFGLNDSKLGLFIAQYNADGWSQPMAFTHNSTDTTYSIAHPALSADGNTLYFASDMPGGFGGKDLYMCSRNDEAWGTPVNLGPVINSAYDEIFPSLCEEGKLFFTSSRLQDMGMDIYTSTQLQGVWSEPTRLEAPVNTAFDDFAFVMNSDSESGYFSSNRNEKNDDLYSFQITYPQFEGCPVAELPSLCYLFEEVNILPNDSLPLTYEWEFGDGSTASGLSAEHCFKGYGRYHVALNVYNSLTKQKFARVSEVDVQIEQSPFPYITSADSAFINEVVSFSPDGTDLASFQIEEYYWNFGDGRNVRGREAWHCWKQPGVYEVQLGIIGKSTSGEVSEKRCATKRIAIGTVQQLAALNDENNSNDMQMSALQQDMAMQQLDSIQQLKYVPDSLLYFVEFKQSREQIALDDPYFSNIKYEITERYAEEETTYKYSVGGTTEMQVLVRIYNDLVANGYTESIVRDEKQDAFSHITTKKWWYLPDSLTTAINNHLNKFNDIRFRPDEYEIQPASYDNMDYIAQVMLLEPELNLRIMAHTDSMGTEEHNQILSGHRAEAVAHYLMSKGVAPSRLIPKGFGEYMPLADNGSEEGRATNRRVTFEIAIDASQKKRGKN
ncbi:MAG: PKD domain-containing protein [Flavobacteriales bacterium]